MRTTCVIMSAVVATAFQTSDADIELGPLKLDPGGMKGRIGFQELSRRGSHVLIRKARITENPTSLIFSTDYKF